MTTVPTWAYLALCALAGFGAGQIAYYIKNWRR